MKEQLVFVSLVLNFAEVKRQTARPLTNQNDVGVSICQCGDRTSEPASVPDQSAPGNLFPSSANVEPVDEAVL